MPDTAEELRRIALEEFVSAGYHGTSLQQIADRAGISKASVLYHYDSKEHLLEAALAPAVDRLEDLIRGIERLRGDADSRAAFLEQFVDVLLDHRLAVYVFVNQAASLGEVPVIARANAQIACIADYFEEHAGSLEEKVRWGVALGGAAYLLVAVHMLHPVIGEQGPDLRGALLATLRDLLSVPATA